MKAFLKELIGRFIPVILLVLLLLTMITVPVMAAPMAQTRNAVVVVQPASPVSLFASMAVRQASESEPTIPAILAIITVMLFLASVVEALVEYVFGQIFQHVPKLVPFQWLLTYIAMVVGIVCSLAYKFDLIYLLGKFLEQSVSGVVINIPLTLVGTILTGMIIGRGSNFLHDLVTQFFVKSS